MNPSAVNFTISFDQSCAEFLNRLESFAIDGVEIDVAAFFNIEILPYSADRAAEAEFFLTASSKPGAKFYKLF